MKVKNEPLPPDIDSQSKKDSQVPREQENLIHLDQKSYLNSSSNIINAFNDKKDFEAINQNLQLANAENESDKSPYYETPKKGEGHPLISHKED